MKKIEQEKGIRFCDRCEVVQVKRGQRVCDHCKGAVDFSVGGMLPYERMTR
jgi:hypothetical protein